MFPEHGRSAAELIQHADTAMYGAKRQGRAGYEFFDSSQGEAIYAELVLESELHWSHAGRVRAVLSAADGRQNRQAGWRRGAAALAPPDARPALARCLHQRGRAAPPDAAGPMGAARGRRQTVAWRQAGWPRCPSPSTWHACSSTSKALPLPLRRCWPTPARAASGWSWS